MPTETTTHRASLGDRAPILEQYPDLERRRPDFEFIANGLDRQVFEAAYELSMGGKLLRYKNSPWSAVADNDSSQLFHSIKAIATIRRRCMHRIPDGAAKEDTVHEVLRLYHGRLDHEIREAGGSANGDWRWTAEHFVEASTWDVAEQDFYERYPMLKPMDWGLHGRRGCNSLVELHPSQPAPDFQDGINNWDWNGPMFRYHFLGAWYDSNNDLHANRKAYTFRDLGRDLSRNRGSWFVEAARRIFADAFLQTGQIVETLRQSRHAYHSFCDWLYQIHGEQPLFTMAEWLDAARTPSDAGFYGVNPHLFKPSCGTRPWPVWVPEVGSGTVAIPSEKGLLDRDQGDDVDRPVEYYSNVAECNRMKYEIGKKEKWPHWTLQQPYNVGRPPMASEFEDPYGMPMTNRVRLANVRNWPELDKCLRKISRHPHTPTASRSEPEETGL
ncbi:hypothetical protein SCUP515_00665 [Seiridium cupressi]